MLYSAVLNLYTDHKNLIFKTLSQQQVRRWRLWLEDYNITFQYIKGEKNILSTHSVWKNEFKGTLC